MKANQTFIDLNREPAISLSKASRLPQCHIDERPVNPSTVFRWANIGIRRRTDGQRVLLETTRRGHMVVTSEAALDRFFARLNGNDTSPELANTAADRAELEMLAAGIA